jgi:hypothetical protein
MSIRRRFCSGLALHDLPVFDQAVRYVVPGTQEAVRYVVPGTQAELGQEAVTYAVPGTRGPTLASFSGDRGREVTPRLSCQRCTLSRAFMIVRNSGRDSRALM